MLRHTYVACVVITQIQCVYFAVRNDSLNATQIILVFKGLIKHDAVLSFEGIGSLGSVFAKNPAIVLKIFVILLNNPHEILRVMSQIMPQPSVALSFAMHSPYSPSTLYKCELLKPS